MHMGYVGSDALTCYCITNLFYITKLNMILLVGNIVILSVHCYKDKTKFAQIVYIPVVVIVVVFSSGSSYGSCVNPYCGIGK